MIDLVSLTIKAGRGGDGSVSFRREKYVPKGGPDGGHGGDGGSVILVGSKSHNTLQHFSGVREITAQSGGQGGARQKTGAKGEDKILTVPLGTVVWLTAEFKSLPERLKLAEISKEGQRVALCRGGAGGRGNIAFKSSTNTTPRTAERGMSGEQKTITLELKLLADVGLVGLPNAGKSTLLTKITRANPKTADYPFTTLEPNLGILTFDKNQTAKDLVVADIPGLIEGAHQGKGLGHDFLRHIENSRALVFVLFLDENVLSDTNLTDEQKAELVWRQYQQLQTELKEYQKDLPAAQPTGEKERAGQAEWAGKVEMLKKPALIALNKIDLYSPELISAVERRFKKTNQKILPFSGFTGENLSKLVQKIVELI